MMVTSLDIARKRTREPSMSDPVFVVWCKVLILEGVSRRHASAIPGILCHYSLPHIRCLCQMKHQPMVTFEESCFTSIFREVSGHVSAVTFDAQMSHQQHPRNAAWISRRPELGHAHVPAQAMVIN